MHDTHSWLEALGLGDCADAFAANDVDVEIRPELTDADRKELA